LKTRHLHGNWYRQREHREGQQPHHVVSRVTS
jgi:hypothetical protein